MKPIELKDTLAQVEDIQLTSVLKKPGQIIYSKVNEEPLKMPMDTNYYEQGKRDARKFHRKRALGNFGLGCFMLPGLIGVALSPAKKPDVKDIKDEALLKNPEYLSGYRHTAKSKNIGNALLGTSTAMTVGTFFFILSLAAR